MKRKRISKKINLRIDRLSETKLWKKWVKWCNLSTERINNSEVNPVN